MTSPEPGRVTEEMLGVGVTTESLDECVERMVGWCGPDRPSRSKPRSPRCPADPPPVLDMPAGLEPPPAPSAAAGPPRVLACANPHSLEVARRDAAFHEALRGADLVLPDGIGIVLASRLRGGRIRQRITGFDAFMAISRALDADAGALNANGGARYFFVGARQDTLDELRSTLAREFPSIVWAGGIAPSFAPELPAEESRRIVEAVNAARADVLWVGLTAPKQEKWISRHRGALDVRVIGAIGAAFDFSAGVKRRAPGPVQRMGLEWLFRLCLEPRRLWHRTLISAPLFLWHAVGQRDAAGPSDASGEAQPRGNDAAALYRQS